jgi:predicted deacylase
MRYLGTKSLSIIAFVFVVLGILAYLFIDGMGEIPSVPEVSAPAPEPVLEATAEPTHRIIGESVEGRAINAYTYGEGETHLLFVGGIHGGYEWNSVLLAHTFMDHLLANPLDIPENIKVTIIPSANPDGLYQITGSGNRFALADIKEDSGIAGLGRLNANGVDLNRNFDCKWKPESMWRSKVVSAGIEAFSEPEAQAIRDFVLSETPTAVIFWHSQSNAVYASECEAGILPGTRSVMNAYSQASGYKAVDAFDAYEITGDAEGWLASIGIPAVTVELATHETIEWERNLRGVEALFELYKKGGQ